MAETNDKLDLAKTDKTYYGAGKTAQIVELDEIGYVSVTGQGSPEGELFASSIEAMYTVAYAVKGRCKAAGEDFTVPKLEGLWWVEDMSVDPLSVPREQWLWKLLIRMPEFAGEPLVNDARSQAAMKKQELARIADVQYTTLKEGTSVQMLHVGPFSTEPETLSVMYRFIEDQGLAINGLHHEIYLSDFRKTEPSKLRTILRYPVRPV
ncbi:GyrI-like domain-containing protein [Paenibacillus kobensis]|uniref:GyrI-like domain-containing protein n=1 Tax=Paenibacillus kobensis TaxID=59841 RepID=UPI000FD84286|nr:GyrI-like domain-containing protein [Paenibacillus kobensis]